MSDRKNQIFTQGDPEQQASQSAVQAASRHGMASDIMRDDFGITIPAETVPLPSLGKVYPEGHALHNRSTVDITPMSAREEDILTSSALLKKGTVITELLRSCIVDKSIRPETILSGDRNALMVAVRITGYGRAYNAEITCEACGERSDVEFDLASLPLSPLEISPTEPGQNIFSFTLPQTGANVQFSFLTGKVEEELLQEQERKRKKLKLSTDSLVTSRLEKCIQSVNGVTDRNKIAHFVRHMPAGDSRALRKYIEKNEPGLEMKGWVRCEHCGEDQLAAMPIGASFFWPDA